MPISESEEISARLYFNYLCEKGFNPNCKRGDDPPDFIFEYEDSIQAVEVTELHKYFADDNSVIPEIQSIQFIQQICLDAKQRLGKNLNRTIKLCLTLPLKVQERRLLLDEIIYFVENENTSERYLFGKNNCWISSENGEPDIVPLTTTSGSSKTPGTDTIHADIQESLDYSISRILDAKIPSLEQLTSFDHRILIIYSNHMFGTLERVQSAINNYGPITNCIDYIFLIKDSQIERLTIIGRE